MVLCIGRETRQMERMWHWKKSEFQSHRTVFRWQRSERFHCWKISILTTIRTLWSKLNAFVDPQVVPWINFVRILSRLLDVIHRRAERDNMLELYLVFEYLERDLADYISHLPSSTVIPTHQIQVIVVDSNPFWRFSGITFRLDVSQCFLPYFFLTT